MRVFGRGLAEDNGRQDSSQPSPSSIKCGDELAKQTKRLKSYEVVCDADKKKLKDNLVAFNNYEREIAKKYGL